jgi:DNA-directed RNA polymerase specialized sigma24 family protein
MEFWSLRNTGGHEVFSLDGLRSPVPNHREIARHGALDHATGGSQVRRGVVDVSTYQVTATRQGDWWSLVAHDVLGREVASQSRRLDQADAAIREAIALVLDVDGEEFELQISPDLRHVEVSDDTLEALELRRALAELSDRARRRTPAAVAELRAAGLTVRDVAQLLGVTPSRVSQIEKQDHLANSA